MKSGRLDRFVTFQRATLADDGFSQTLDNWADIARVPAEVTPISDGERWRAGEVGASATHRFRVRWQQSLADLNPKDRVVYDDRAFDISGVKEIGRREGLEVTAMSRSDR
jgi:SPP1 family predicted phage head-tail adaptor